MFDKIRAPATLIKYFILILNTVSSLLPRVSRPGIGGFMVRQRSRTGQGIAKRSLSRKASTWSLPENPMCKEEGKDNGLVPKVQTPPIWDSTQNQSLNPIRSGVPECYFEVVTSCRCVAGWNETESTPVEETPPVPECQEKVKKRYRKKKTKLEEEFPSYLQVTVSLMYTNDISFGLQCSF